MDAMKVTFAMQIRARRNLYRFGHVLVSATIAFSAVRYNATAADAQPQSRMQDAQTKTFASDFYLTIATDKKVYTSSEPVLVKLGFRNVSSKRITASVDTPWSSSQINVYSGGGRRVAPTLAMDASIRPSLHFLAFPPHGHASLSTDGRVWFDLKRWGYALAPGKYTLRGRPLVRGPYLIDDSSLRSDAVTFEILRKAAAAKP